MNDIAKFTRLINERKYNKLSLREKEILSDVEKHTFFLGLRVRKAIFLSYQIKTLQMNINLEKLVFLEMTNKEMAQLPNQDYFETYKMLSEKEKEYFGALSRQIHNIWTELNTQSSPNINMKVADTIIEYNDNIEPIDSLILKCHSDYGITLKRTMNDKFKAALIKFLGNDFYDNHFG